MIRNISWFILAISLSALFIYGYELYVMNSLTKLLTGSSFDKFHQMSSDAQNTFVSILNIIITPALFIAKAFVALLGTAIANGLFRQGFKAQIGPGQ